MNVKFAQAGVFLASARIYWVRFCTESGCADPRRIAVARLQRDLFRLAGIVEVQQRHQSASVGDDIGDRDALQLLQKGC